MPKALCLISLVICALLALVFLCDLALPSTYAPFGRANWFVVSMDIVGLIATISIAMMSFTTLRQQ